jgi:hypothetical protein
MSAPFEGLRERLLRGGIAPRHVRRYLRELDEHLTDLIADQQAAGYDGEDALMRARARLGDDAELAQAMIEQRDFRSISARFPWAVFTLLPPLTMLLVVAAPVLLIAGMAKLGEVLLGLHGVAEPVWFQLLAHGLLAVASFLTIPLAALLFTIIAWRQRLSAWWVVLALGVMAPMVWCASMDFPTAAEAARHKPAALSIGFGFSTNGAYASVKDIAWLAGHYLLALLPLGWLMLARRRALAKVPFPS